MCRDMTVEDNYLTVFENTASYEIVKGELLLRDKNGEIIARFISL
jgi:heat shock protein HslJ